MEPQPKRVKLDEAAAVEAEVEERVLEDLRQLQSELDQVNDELADKICELEQQYVKQRAPIYEKRAAACSKIPQFWHIALRQHPLISTLVTDDDMDMLKYLTDLLVKDNADVRTGYKIVLRFANSPFFSNEELVKCLKVNEDGTLAASCTPVQWKDSKEGAQAKLLKQERQEGAQANSEDDGRLTFFDWLCEPEHFDHNESDDVAEAIKQEIWPDPLQFYLDQAEADYELNGDEDRDEDEEEEDEDEGPTPEEEDL